MTTHGVIHDGPGPAGAEAGSNVRSLNSARQQRNQSPTCPWCGITGTASRVNNPNGEWFCSCGSLFNGTDVEWRKLAAHRRASDQRRANDASTEAS